MDDTAGRDVFTDVTAVTFVRTEDGVDIVDPIERHRVRLHADIATPPTSIPTNRFPLPLDTATEFRTAQLTVPVAVVVYVRNSSGELVGQAEHFAFEELPSDEYILEFTSPIKVYARVDGPLTIRSDADTTEIDLHGESVVELGARSFHDSPATTITTTTDPRDVMAAVSAFGHAMKTTGPERSYPTLRGHPPLLEVGSTLDVPESVERPESTVRVEVPPEFASIYPAAPLAYYLGATLEPGPRPQIVTDDGRTHSLDGPRGFEETVARTLKQLFLLDCVTRPEGFYDVTLNERLQLEGQLDLDFAALYDASAAERLDAFLDVPYDVVEPYVPTWKTTAYVPPSSDSLELIPFLVNELAVLKTPADASALDTSTQAAAVDDFFRTSDGFTRGASADAHRSEYVRPPASNSTETVWAGPGTPIGAGKAMTEAYRNRLERTPVEGDITISVVCNAPEMLDERDVLDDVYGTREEVPFEIRRYEQLTRAELREVLAADADFLHYIGHIDDEGIECADGKLDPETVTETGVDAFLLNACSSYDAGKALIRGGAIGGIVTLSDVLNNAAVTMGSNLAKLLNQGFPLGTALEIARDESYAGGQYTIVGHGGASVAQPKHSIPNLVRVAEKGDGFDVRYEMYPTDTLGLGTEVIPFVTGNDTYFLAGSQNIEFSVSGEELAEALLATDPVIVDGDLRWWTELDFE